MGGRGTAMILPPVVLYVLVAQCLPATTHPSLDPDRQLPNIHPGLTEFAPNEQKSNRGQIIVLACLNYA